MRKDLIRIPTQHMSRGDWLLRRRRSIGGSDAAAIVGLSPYASAYTVWADKLAKLPEKPDSEAMRLGRDLEDYVAQRFCEKENKRVRREMAMLYNPDYPFAHADIDRKIVGENAGLECKTTNSMQLKRFKDGEFPAEYYAQCVHYMAVSGAARWYLAVLVLGVDFFVFCIERDEVEIAALMAQEEAFWQLVQSETPPAPDGHPATSRALSTVYTESCEGLVDLFGREDLLREYQATQEEIKSMERRAERIKQTLMLDMGQAEQGHCGDWAVSWKQQKRRSFDVARFLSEHPSVDVRAYWTEQGFRRFQIKEIATNGK